MPRMFPDREFLEMAPDKSHLITEDWITTGRTLLGVLGELTSRQARDVRVATIKQDPGSLNKDLLRSCNIYAGETSRYLGGTTDVRKN